MKKNRLLLVAVAAAMLVAPAFAQQKKKPAIFAVLDGGKTIEPIAYVDGKTLTEPVGGSAERKDIKAFNAVYYRPQTKYRLIFGGAAAGTVTAVKSDYNSECSANLGTVTVAAKSVKLGGMVMALATDAAGKSPASGLRRKPTPAERAEIEALVKSAFAAEKVKLASAAALRSHNLTALDLNNDKSPEFVGTYWVASGVDERSLLFFIAEKGASGKYEIGYQEFRKVKKDEVMSGEIKTLDQGIYHELLLDAFDYDDDGSAEVFTYVQGFEGSSFAAYKKSNGKWTRSFEGANYHCGY